MTSHFSRMNLDSPSHSVRSDSERALKQELAWAHHISCSAVLAPVPAKTCPNYARALYSQFGGYGNTVIHVRMPIVWPDSSENDADPWETWNSIRTLCEHHSLLSVALEITSELPSEETIEQWKAEPVKLVILPTKVFLTNAGGYPVLSKKHQALFQTLFSINVDIAISGRARHDCDIPGYIQYLQVTSYDSYFY